MLCPSCRKSIDGDSRICKYCGFRANDGQHRICLGLDEGWKVLGGERPASSIFVPTSRKAFKNKILTGVALQRDGMQQRKRFEVGTRPPRIWENPPEWQRILQRLTEEAREEEQGMTRLSDWSDIGGRLVKVDVDDCVAQLERKDIVKLRLPLRILNDLQPHVRKDIAILHTENEDYRWRLGRDHGKRR